MIEPVASLLRGGMSVWPQHGGPDCHKQGGVPDSLAGRSVCCFPGGTF